MKILFLCVANSIRSQMAEGLAKNILESEIKKGKASVQSAGSVPHVVHPMVKQVMAEIGIDISDQYSKSVYDIDPKTVDTVITLCQDEVCPPVFMKVKHLHWPTIDPSSEGIRGFRQVRDELSEKIKKYVAE